MAEFGIDPQALVFDATNFHTYIASTNDRAPIAQRGHAKSKRHDLRLVGLALACSTDHQIPLAHRAVAGNLPDVKVFADALPRLITRLEAIGVEPASVCVVFDKGNNSAANIEDLARREIGFVGSLVPTQHADLLAVPDGAFEPVDSLEGVVAHRSEKEIFGAYRTVVVTRSERFLSEQLVGLAQTRRRVEVQLAELVRLCGAHRHKMDPARLQARVDDALAPRWMARLYRTAITGTTRDDLALSWSFDEDAFAALTQRELGKRIIFTDRGAWSTRDIVVAYRSQWEVEAAFRQMKNPEHAAFRPIHHWTDLPCPVLGGRPYAREPCLAGGGPGWHRPFAQRSHADPGGDPGGHPRLPARRATGRSPGPEEAHRHGSDPAGPLRAVRSGRFCTHDGYYSEMARILGLSWAFVLHAARNPETQASWPSQLNASQIAGSAERGRGETAFSTPGPHRRPPTWAAPRRCPTSTDESAAPAES
jgi:hypothetical protein